MDDDNWMELFETYSEMVEKQDEIICRMGKIIARQAQDICLIANDREFSDAKLESDMMILDEVLREYESYIKP